MPDLAILGIMNPDKIGRYEIKEELGRGGMATVYRAYDPLFEREVAVKVLPREMLHDPQFRVRFEREAKTIAMLEHPAIVPVYDFGEDDGQPYFVMRFMSGGSLSDRLKQGPLSVQKAASMMERLAPALDDAHVKGIIHRDLKPGNILYDKRDDPYVSDFGIAKITEGGSNVTGSAIIGTPAYMSPEQAQGEAIDGRADIYALGVILFEILSGRQPYEADTPMGVVIKHITDPVPHILDARSDLSPAIEAIIEKAMAKNREERYATAGALSADLLNVARGIVLDLPEATRLIQQNSRASTNQTLVANLPPSLPKKKKTNLWLALAIFGFLAVAGLAVLVFAGYKILPLVFSEAKNTPVSVLALPTNEILSPSLTPEKSLAAVTLTSMPPSPEPATSVPATSIPATSTPQGIPVVGGADQVAFLANKNVWSMNLDGSNLQQLTNDTSLKTSLQWLPSGQGLLYITGKCIRLVEFATGKITDLTCFLSSEALDAFEISPDGSQVAITLDHVLYIVPFDLDVLKNAHDHPDLIAMNGCINNYKVNAFSAVNWSQDGLKVALGLWGVEDARRVDMVRVLDISTCDTANLTRLDEFPGSFFVMDGYAKNPVIPSFSWDGQSLFVLNSTFFNGDFGHLYKYNMNLHKAEKINPVDDTCCYLDASWSPDGNYIVFAFSDFRKGGASQTELYYIPFGTIGTGDTYSPIPLPVGFFTNQREAPQPVLRPAK
jgi:serine/threonine-protein kinase